MSEASKLIQPTECPYYLISRASLTITSALKRGFILEGVKHLKPAYLGVLLSLWNEDGLKVVEVGRRAGLEPSTMTGLLDRMERDALLKRSASTEDRRVQRVHLTEYGQQIRGPALRVVEKTLAKVFEGIQKGDLDRTKEVLRSVLGNVHEEGEG